MLERISKNVVKVSKRNLSEVKSNRAARELSITMLQSQISARCFRLDRFMKERSAVIL